MGGKEAVRRPLTWRFAPVLSRKRERLKDFLSCAAGEDSRGTRQVRGRAKRGLLNFPHTATLAAAVRKALMLAP